MLEIENEITRARIRPAVTMCLYLTPDKRAGSLSMLMAAEVKRDTVQRIVKETVEIAAD